MFLSPVAPEEVLDCIKLLDNRKANGPSSIPSQVISLIKTEISKPLADIFNLCFQCGIFPDKLKTAVIIPVYKKGDKTDPNNYRPISLLSNLDKILERLIYNRTYSFITKHKLLFTNQFGFRRSHSTVHTLLNMCQKISDALDEKKFAIGVFVDLQKAFDTVDHEILLAKLQYYGFQGKTLSLYRSYLTGRNQFVCVSGHESALALVTHGVPQGSVLGPLLFLLYINDLHFAIINSIVHHFADDTNLVCISNDLKSLVRSINLDLKLLWHWLNANKISLNAAKTEYILFRHPNKRINQLVKLTIGGKRISESKTIKYLGVLLDFDLKWKSQINATVVKLKRANRILSKLRHHVPLPIRKLVYFSLFASHLMYCCQIWGQPVSTNLERVTTQQKIALRTINFSDYRAHASPLFKYFDILKFSDIVTILNVLLMYDVQHNLIPSSIIDIYQVDFSHAHNTRANTEGKVNSVYSSTDCFGNYSVKLQAMKSWNDCVDNFGTTRFVEMSRPELKKLLITKLTEVY